MLPPLTRAAGLQDALPKVVAPSNSVVAGQTYVYWPRLAVADQSVLRFEIQNKPAWAQFNEMPGLLTGRPANAQAGVYRGIRIFVSDGKTRVQLPEFSIAVVADNEPRSITLSWTPPTEHTDGKVLTNLIGYRIYSGSDPNRLVPLAAFASSGLTRYVVEGLTPGLRYFAITAISPAGESEMSTVVAKRIE